MGGDGSPLLICVAGRQTGVGQGLGSTFLGGFDQSLKTLGDDVCIKNNGATVI